MEISQEGLQLIKKYEGYRSRAYKCPAGVWTIGWGHTSGVKEGDTCTESQAEDFLKSDIAAAQTAVNYYVHLYHLSQAQYDALVSFTYNCGQGNLHQLTQSGKRTMTQIIEKITAYNKANGKVLAGLTRRRLEEQRLLMHDAGTDCYYPPYSGSSVYIDVVMQSIGADKDYDMKASKPWNRRLPIAKANGILSYTGTAGENQRLIAKAKRGALKRP